VAANVTIVTAEAASGCRCTIVFKRCVRSHAVSRWQRVWFELGVAVGVAVRESVGAADEVEVAALRRAHYAARFVSVQLAVQEENDLLVVLNDFACAHQLLFESITVATCGSNTAIQLFDLGVQVLQVLSVFVDPLFVPAR